MWNWRSVWRRPPRLRCRWRNEASGRRAPPPVPCDHPSGRTERCAPRRATRSPLRTRWVKRAAAAFGELGFRVFLTLGPRSQLASPDPPPQNFVSQQREPFTPGSGRSPDPMRRVRRSSAEAGEAVYNPSDSRAVPHPGLAPCGVSAAAAFRTNTDASAIRSPERVTGRWSGSAVPFPRLFLPDSRRAGIQRRSPARVGSRAQCPTNKPPHCCGCSKRRQSKRTWTLGPPSTEGVRSAGRSAICRGSPDSSSKAEIIFCQPST